MFTKSRALACVLALVSSTVFAAQGHVPPVQPLAPVIIPLPARLEHNVPFLDLVPAGRVNNHAHRAAVAAYFLAKHKHCTRCVVQVLSRRSR